MLIFESLLFVGFCLKEGETRRGDRPPRGGPPLLSLSPSLLPIHQFTVHVAPVRPPFLPPPSLPLARPPVVERLPPQIFFVSSLSSFIHVCRRRRRFVVVGGCSQRRSSMPHRGVPPPRRRCGGGSSYPLSLTRAAAVVDKVSPSSQSPSPRAAASASATVPTKWLAIERRRRRGSRHRPKQSKAATTTSTLLPAHRVRVPGWPGVAVAFHLNPSTI